MEVKGQTTVELEADEYYFKPTFLHGVPGQRLQLEIENESGTLHNISLPEQHLDMDIPPKGKVAVEVVFPASGAVRFFCALGACGAEHLSPQALARLNAEPGIGHMGSPDLIAADQDFGVGFAKQMMVPCRSRIGEMVSETGNTWLSHRTRRVS
jgi:hypothetical protein